ncbi:hypothetical protein BDN70DRAFT_938159 [Pholiota conissans]|uniref:Uncharacterized protein n=1 Tax=Pholiota conissans TaxID=109636 RepID=A0A9P6CN53_9AGAR|nr:hypothetical protein BDN70DRAFT_938155 [Pholiota conissans]KAF9472481.1 hypothetical protein BDN70DRAFT_938159 [Pholiota conissans]
MPDDGQDRETSNRPSDRQSSATSATDQRPSDAPSRPVANGEDVEMPGIGPNSINDDPHLQANPMVPTSADIGNDSTRTTPPRVNLKRRPEELSQNPSTVAAEDMPSKIRCVPVRPRPMQDMLDKIDVLVQRNNALTIEKDVANAKRAEAVSTKESLSTQLNQANDKIVELQRKIDEASERVENALRENDQLESTLANVSENLDEREQISVELELLKEEKKEQDTAIQDLQKKIDEKNGKIDELERRTVDIVTQQKELEHQIFREKELSEKVKKDVTTQKSAVETLKRQIELQNEEVEKMMKKKEGELEDATSRFRAAEAVVNQQVGLLLSSVGFNSY